MVTTLERAANRPVDCIDDDLGLTIDLEIHAIADLLCAERREPDRLGNEMDPEGLRGFVPPADREARPLQRDEALVEDVPRQLDRDAQDQGKVVGPALDAHDLGGSVHVTGEHVAAVLVALSRRALDVREGSLGERPEGRDAQRLVVRVEVDERACEACDRLADTVDRYARPELQFAALRFRELDGVREGAALADNRSHGKRPLNDAGEHGREPSPERPTWRAGFTGYGGPLPVQVSSSGMRCPQSYAILACLFLGGAGCARPPASGSTRPAAAPADRASACFLLYEVGLGEVVRAPAEGCSTRVTPASTFKIPHALAALDAGVVSGPDAILRYDGAPVRFDAWRRDHTLASAMRYSVVWYFQDVARLLGATREQLYLRRFEYGNQDPSSGLDSFWLGGSLLVSPDEQERFLVRLYENALPVSETAMQIVRSILVQPRGVVVIATGEHPFAPPWPADAVVSAKTGSSDDDRGRSVRWLVGHVERQARSWVFVSCVAGSRLEPLAALGLAEDSLRRAGVL